MATDKTTRGYTKNLNQIKNKMKNIKDEIAEKHGYADFFQIEMTDDDIYEQTETMKDILEECVVELEKRIANPKWISIKEQDLSHLKEGDGVLTLDEKGNIIPYKYFLGGLNMIGEHSDNNRKVTHWFPLPSAVGKTEC